MCALLRYGEEPQIVHTRLNPLDDLISWISGLKSRDVNADILRGIHGHKNIRDIKILSKAISEYIDLALNYYLQAYSGSSESAFLSLYYFLLNLSKIYIIISGKKKQLDSARYHGATYLGSTKSRDLINATLKIKEKGAIPLFYEALTGKVVGRKEVKVKLSEIYPFIRNIEHEYAAIYKTKGHFVECLINKRGDDTNGHYFQCRIDEFYNVIKYGKNHLRVLKGFNKVGDKQFETNKTPRASGNYLSRLYDEVRRSLLYCDVHPSGHAYALTPLSSKHLLLPEELPILLAFFHMSMIVRYYPDYLFELRSSKSWPILLALQRHAIFRFMLLFWSYVQRKDYFIITG